MILPALTRGGYTCRQQVAAGSRLGGNGRHFVDAIATKDGVDILVSLKWQQTSGTAEQKVPFEVDVSRRSCAGWNRATWVLGDGR